jgi:phosphoribosyl-ATP pyrophosphohydrolase
VAGIFQAKYHAPSGLGGPPRIGGEVLRSGMSGFTLHDLEERVQIRAKESADVSYTRKLLDRGVAHAAKKLAEEAVEVVIAAIDEDKNRVIAEAADVLYHLLVVLHARGVTLDEVEAELGTRTRQSGLEEKAARKGG